MTSDPPLALEHVSVTFGNTLAIDDVSFAAPDRCVIGVIGPNGAGKSTLFAAILGLVEHTGSIRYAQRPAFVPQGDRAAHDFPVTARDVVLMGRYGYRRWWQRLSRADRAAAEDALEAVGMSEHAGCVYGTLSGGQRQRVILARALAHDRRVILLDEPMTGVDGVSEHAIHDALRTLRDEGRTLLVATHDLSDAARTCDRLLFLNRRLVAYGTPAEAFTAETIEQTYTGAAVMLTRPDGTPLALLDDAHHHEHGEAHVPRDHAEHHHGDGPGR